MSVLWEQEQIRRYRSRCRHRRIVRRHRETTAALVAAFVAVWLVGYGLDNYLDARAIAASTQLREGAGAATIQQGSR